MVHCNETLNMIINATRTCKKTRKMAACSHFSLPFAYVVVAPTTTVSGHTPKADGLRPVFEL